MNRDPYFDVLKFFAMFLVVFGHAYWALECKTGMPYFENFRCGMNMPLFFMISGYFAARTIIEGDWSKLGQRVLGYFWPMAIVSCLFAMLAVAFGIEGCDKGLIGYAGRWFLFSPWFLWCLAICFILTFLLFRLKSRALRGTAFLLLILVLPGFGGIRYVHNVRAMLPHFLFGVFILQRWQIWKDWRYGLPCCMVFLLGVFFQGDILVNGLSFYKNETTWQVFLMEKHSFPLYVVRLVNGVIGSVGVMWLVQALVNRFEFLKRLAPLGTTTLGVYILQWLLARIQDGFSGRLISVCGLSILVFAATHVVALFSYKWYWTNRFVWGNLKLSRGA